MILPVTWLASAPPLRLGHDLPPPSAPTAYGWRASNSIRRTIIRQIANSYGLDYLAKSDFLKGINIAKFSIEGNNIGMWRMKA